jgi:3-hydroxyisobutyrate dehydrogenase-like beta-hydroxyacid dehydrogenase
MHIGFIGLGNMGEAVAANLLKAGHQLTVWNRTASKAQPLLDGGAEQGRTPGAAAAGDVVITLLADDAAVEQVVFGEDGLLAALRPGAVHISMSTISVALAERLTAAHAERGSDYLSAPVFGRPAAARDAALSIVAAGPAAVIARCQPVFDAVSKRTFTAGEAPSAANVVKLCGNFMIMCAIESMAEAMTVAAKSGVERSKLLEVLTGTLFDAPVYRTYGDIIVNERFRPAGFAAPLGLKDMRLIGAQAERERVPMPFLGVIRDHLLSTLAVEGEDIDWSGLAKTVARDAGL